MPMGCKRIPAQFGVAGVAAGCHEQPSESFGWCVLDRSYFLQDKELDLFHFSNEQSSVPSLSFLSCL